MTEAEWLTGVHPWEMLRYLSGEIDQSERKLRLFSATCCRRAAEWFPDLALSLLIDACENGPPGPCHAVDDALERLRHDAAEAGDFEFMELSNALHALATDDLDADYIGIACRDATEYADRPFQADLLREIFGTPFRPVVFDSRWRSTSAVGLARSIDATRDCAAMPLLADSLEEAGCDRDDVLKHCRGAGPHARGCWVVDLVLAKP